jgi:hypothetical protein
MADELAAVRLEVGAQAGSDDEELAELTARLRRELLQLDVEGVERPPSGLPPSGAKGVDAVALGTLVVTLARSPGALAAFAKTVQGWLTSRQSRTVKLELDGDSIELDGVSSRDQERLVELWIGRHTAEA